jgi:hypothetical protein
VFLCLLCLPVRCTEITDVSWDVDLQVIHVAVDAWPANWGDWKTYINNVELNMEGGAGYPVIRPDAPLEQPPTGLFVGTQPWLTGLSSVDFPCKGFIRFFIPGEGLTTNFYFDVSDEGGQTASTNDWPCAWTNGVGGQSAVVKIGNPTLDRYPVEQDARPRSVWDMHYFNGRIYIGSGDYWSNRGPVDIWTYYDGGIGFLKEFTVDEEMVSDFFEFEGKLFIPGNDATEDWSFENLYINDPHRTPHPGWVKHRTLSGGLHSLDVALFKGKVYASITRDGTTSQTLVSTDMGQTWEPFLEQYSSFLVFDDFLFVIGDTNYTYNGITLQTVAPELLLDSWRFSGARTVKFHGGALYSCPLRWGLEASRLVFLPSNQVVNGGVAKEIARFTNENVRDVVVRGDTCYVMTANEIQQDLLYKGRIYTSNDLTNWPMASEFYLPGVPLSFEIMNNRFYVGLGSRWDGAQWDVLFGPEAGSIWRITPTPQFSSMAQSKTNGVSLGLNVVPNFDFIMLTSSNLLSTSWSPLVATNIQSAFYAFTDLSATNHASRFYRALH